MAKRSRIITVIVFIVLLALSAAAAYWYFYLRNDTLDTPPVNGDKFSVIMNDKTIEDGVSIGLLNSGQEFIVDSLSRYDVAVYAYCSRENDFTLIVGDEPYTWGDFDGRNITAGFTFNRTDMGFAVKHDGLNDCISRNLNGMMVKTNEFPPVPIFRMTIATSTKSIEVYFFINAEAVEITLDHTAIIL